MTIRIAINGFGRIGRLVTRIAKMRREFDLAAVNDLGDLESFAPVFKYDSIHGVFPGTIEMRGNILRVEGDSFEFLQIKDPADLPWREKRVDYVVEASGVFRKRADLEKHLAAGARRVVLTVPAKDAIDATVVLGVNDDALKPEHKIVSNASCTTNCAAPVAAVLHERFGIVRGMVNTIHAYTNDQNLMDSQHKDARRGRMAALSIVPTSTGAAKAIGEVLPALKGRLDGMALRVPVPDGSIVDMVVETEKPVTKDAVNTAFFEAEAGPMGRVLEVNRADPIVSVDIIGNPHSAIVDAPLTQCLGDRMARVCAWYDNEWGYANRIVDLIEHMAAQDGLPVKYTHKGTGHFRALGE